MINDKTRGKMKTLQSDQPLGKVIPNIAQLLRRNVENWANKPVYQEKKGEEYVPIIWSDFYTNVENIAFNLRQYGFSRGDKMVFFSRNRLEMLEMEMAVMSTGGVSVPIFSNFNQATAELLINHSDARFLCVSGELQLSRVSPQLELQQTFVLDEIGENEFPNLTAYSKLLKEKTDPAFTLSFDASADEVCLNMYTSGTMGTPKCVQLTHQNILSQQAALQQLWSLDENDRFLSYLPWHHSFGGIFEKFCALCNGAVLSLESSYGKDPKEIFENWKMVKPSVFFSIPKVYKELVDLTKQDQEAEELFFHSGLKFIFTAAAALPEKLSKEFEERGISVIEGWGLTETSPCCTITDPDISRENGVVGKPIPGVSIRLAGDSEIEVQGPNVMVGYYNNEEANEGIFTEDGWFRTGDVGEFTESGLKLIARKDRIFKLLNGEKVIPTELEQIIEKQCHYIKYAMVCGNGDEYPVALLFPNRDLLKNPDYHLSPEEGCFCPKSLDELGKCLRGCLRDANCAIGQKFSRIKAAMIIDEELTLDNQTLTPSMKVAPNKVVSTYKVHLANLYGSNFPVEQENYVIQLDESANINIVENVSKA